MLADGLERLPHVAAVRGRGLMLACELDVHAPAVVQPRAARAATGRERHRADHAAAAAAADDRRGRRRGGARAAGAGARGLSGAARASGRLRARRRSQPHRRGRRARVHQPRVLLGPRAPARARRANRSTAPRRVVGLYRRRPRRSASRSAVSDGVIVAYLADVYVLPAYRGRGLGLALVREIVEGGGADCVGCALAAAHRRRPGPVREARFRRGPPTYPLMERGRGYDPAADEQRRADSRHRAPPPTRPTPSRCTACCCCTPAAWTRA